MIYEYSELAQDSKEPEMTDCPDCDSDRTSYSNCVDGIEIRKCHDCDNYFEIEEE